MLIWLGVVAPGTLRSWQEPATTQSKNAAPSAQIFSGTVTKITDNLITAVRKVVGHDPVTRDFIRDAHTQVEGKLTVGARVTVRYKATDDSGFLAVHVIVR
jgi:hypothetical protein